MTALFELSADLCATTTVDRLIKPPGQPYDKLQVYVVTVHVGKIYAHADKCMCQPSALPGGIYMQV